MNRKRTGKTVQSFRIVLLVALASLFPGCGYFLAGEWSDDPGNWKRAFDETGPAEGIEIAHSWYMRTPHFTHEYAWFFDLKLSKKIREQIRADTGWVRIDATNPDAITRKAYDRRPDWFPSPPFSEFDVYQSGEQPTFLIFIERDGPRSIWTAAQF